MDSYRRSVSNDNRKSVEVSTGGILPTEEGSGSQLFKRGGKGVSSLSTLESGERGKERERDGGGLKLVVTVIG